jgi:hypothetical protein
LILEILFHFLHHQGIAGLIFFWELLEGLFRCLQ